MQNGVVRGKPVGRALVKIPAPGLQEGRIDALLDEGVVEKKVLPVRAHQAVFDEAGAGVAVGAQQMTQGIERKAFADHRGRLQSLLIGDRQPIDTRQDQALNRGRQLRLLALGGVVQELFQEQRVAAGPFDAGLGQGAVRVGIGAGQRDRLLLAQGCQVDGDQGPALGGAAPDLVERIAVDPRGHHQERRTAAHGRRDRGQMVEGLGIGPMDVLDGNKERRAAARRLDQPRHHRLLAAIARLVVHGIVDGPHLGRLWQVEKVVQEGCLMRRHETLGQGPLARFFCRGCVAAGRNRAQAAD